MQHLYIGYRVRVIVYLAALNTGVDSSEKTQKIQKTKIFIFGALEKKLGMTTYFLNFLRFFKFQSAVSLLSFLLFVDLKMQKLKRNSKNRFYFVLAMRFFFVLIRCK